MREGINDYVEIDYISIGRRIRTERKRRGLTQEQLSESTGFSENHISAIENGKTKLSLPALHKVVWALNSSLDALVCDSIPKAKAIFDQEIAMCIKDCDETETRFVADSIKAIVKSLRFRIRVKDERNQNE